MDDFLLILLSGLFDIFVEVFLQVVAESVVALFDRWFQNLFTESKARSPIAAAIGYFFLGLVFGVLSILVAPHPLVRPSKIHGLSLLISPLITGLIMSQIGVWIRRRDIRTVRIESFAYGAIFALGVATVRFLWLR
jgi:hypothetical protein